MNSIDFAILEILTGDARTPHAQIAEKVGLSRPAVAERVKKLEQANIIKEFDLKRISSILSNSSHNKAVLSLIRSQPE